ncbi:hypothetical protein SCBWM1_gp1 [Synechococcus phage S-CBWM1]|uniref:Uncharacterized protein n=1 Tax=Synechococcus phage S-CBWM1 TaxID=2053653 RepID=A0A3G1L3A6_9CAUD|nr:hypothetical protein HOU61_gp002 [Synechococcus phage S-CBWM1]ATW62685.1 hypothetical protein SCBWM1_gp1 [Synechococcus phage S-CBWM1]
MNQEIQTKRLIPRRSTLSKAYLEANNLLPGETEWREGGRPIYERLPSASESYRKDFFEDGSQGYVFIGQRVGSTGPGSLNVIVSEDRREILVHGGISLWKYGRVEHPPTLINLESVGMQSTKYLIAHQMSYDSNPREIFRSVEAAEISGIDLIVSSSTDETIGWRNPASNAFSYGEDLVWKNYDSFFQTQPDSCFLSWEHQRGFTIQSAKVVCPPGFQPNQGTLADLYVDGEFLSTAEAEFGATGAFYEFFLDNGVTGKEWKVIWNNLQMEVQNVLMTGEFPTTYRPKTTSMRTNLVAYPAYEYPEENFAYCRLAYLDVGADYRVIGEPQDIRHTVYRDYQPVAEWLTRPWDEMLERAYIEHKEYVNRRMSPTSTMRKEYENLEELGLFPPAAG